MGLLCLGINHKTAPLSVRERLAFSAAEAPPALRALRQLAGVTEAVLLSTCNRVECYLVCRDGARARGRIVKLLQKIRKLPRTSLEKAIYEFKGLQVVQHLIEVASSLDSQVVGETQILSQVREAHAMALREGATAALLNGIFNRALAAAKRVRHETEIGRLPVSVSSVAVHLAGKIFGEMKEHPVLLLGTGETSVLVAQALMGSGAPRLIVAGEKHFGRAQSLAAEYGGEAMKLSQAQERLAEVDIVIVATASSGYVIKREHVAEALGRRKSRPMFLMDLSVPRNIDPAVAGLVDAYLYNLDDLRTVADENIKRREEWVAPAREIVADEVGRAESWMGSLEVVPTIVALQGYAEKCRQEVWGRAGRAVKDLPVDARAEVEYLTKALVTKILHRPVSELKVLAGQNRAASFVEVLRKLFKLD